MSTKYTIIGAILAIVIAISAVAAYAFLSQPGTRTHSNLNGSGASFPLATSKQHHNRIPKHKTKRSNQLSTHRKRRRNLRFKEQKH